MNAPPGHPLAHATALGRALADNVSRVVLGKPETVQLAVAAALAGGHVLVEDVPGVGKTVLARALATSLGGRFVRIQGTPDLLPADLAGVSVFEPGKGEWSFRPGPLFANVVLFDEINRTTPRCQSALFEAMAEGQVTVEGVTRPLPRPFLLLATQNPFGDAGTFPLGAGQRDRFAAVVSLDLPDLQAERALLLGHGGQPGLAALQPVATPEALLAARTATAALHVDGRVVDYVLAIVGACRAAPGAAHGPSPRASLTLLAFARALAVLAGRDFVQPDDVIAAAGAVLAHRVAAGLPAGEARQHVARIVASVPVPPR
jgi:MoxR-like ATPase